MYIRDKRSPVPLSEAVSRVMSANRDRDTRPELRLRKALWHAGLRGYRLHRPVRTASGSDRQIVARPDISFVGKKLAIFVHGCFWHRCPKCKYKLPKTNTEFWKQKFERNVARDESKRIALESQGWTVITVWECELKTNLDSTIVSIQKALN